MGVNGCLFIYVGPAMHWRSVQGILVSWDNAPYPHFCCIGMGAEISETNISKPGKVKPKLSAGWMILQVCERYSFWSFWSTAMQQSQGQPQCDMDSIQVYCTIAQFHCSLNWPLWVVYTVTELHSALSTLSWSRCWVEVWGSLWKKEVR